MVHLLGVSGAGWHTRNCHLKPGILGDAFVVAALFDPSESDVMAAQRIPGVGGAVVCGSFEEMLGRTEVTALLIADDPETHALRTLAAVRAGKHVLVDTPLALNNGRDVVMMQEAQREAQQRDLVLTTCLSRQAEGPRRPYGWAYSQLPELTEQFGALQLVVLDSSYSVSPPPRRPRPLLLDHGPHDIGAAFWFGSRAYPGDLRWHVRPTDMEMSPVSYGVAGSYGPVHFTCHGTRLVQQANVFEETIFLRFAGGECEIRAHTGEVTLRQHGSRAPEEVFKIDSRHREGDYDRFREIMAAFAAAITAGTGGAAHLTQDEFWRAAYIPLELLNRGIAEEP